MAGLNGKGPDSHGRFGGRLGRCVKAKRDKRSDTDRCSGMRRDADAAFDKSSRRSRGRCRRRNGTRFNVQLDEAI